MDANRAPKQVLHLGEWENVVGGVGVGGRVGLDPEIGAARDGATGLSVSISKNAFVPHRSTFSLGPAF